MRLICLGLLLLGFNNATEAQLLQAPDQATINRLGLVFARVSALDAHAGAEVSARIISSPLQADGLHARFAGTLLQWQVAPGDAVASGAVLGILQSPEVLAIQQEYLQSRADSRQADAALARDSQLLDSGIIAASREQQTRRTAETASAAVASLAASLQQAGFSKADLAALSTASTALGHYILRASQDAVIGRLMVVPGSAVAIGEELLGFNSPTLWVEADIPGSLATTLVPGQSLQVAGVSSPVVLRQLDRSLSQRSQTVGIKGEFTAPVTLAPGQIVKLVLSPQAGGWLVPAEAVVHNGDQTEVFIRTAAGIESRVLELAPAGNDYQVLGGLDGNELLVVRGAALLKGIALGLGGE